MFGGLFQAQYIHMCLNKSFGQAEMGCDVMKPKNINNECFPTEEKWEAPTTRQRGQDLNHFKVAINLGVNIPILRLHTHKKARQSWYVLRATSLKKDTCLGSKPPESPVGSEQMLRGSFPFQGYLSEEALQNLPVNEQDGPKHQRMFEQLGPAILALVLGLDGDFWYFPTSVGGFQLVMGVPS